MGANRCCCRLTVRPSRERGCGESGLWASGRADRKVEGGMGCKSGFVVTFTLAATIGHASAGAQAPVKEETMVSAVLPIWQMIERSMIGVAEAMPEDKW